MRTTKERVFVAAFSAANVVALAARAAILYNPVVTMIGDGTAAVTDQGRTVTIRVYANTTAAQAAPISQLAFNSGATGTRLIDSDSATSEGMLSNNPALIDKAAAGQSYSGNAYVFTAGYDEPNGTGSGAATLESATTAAPRVIGYMSVNGSTVSGANIPQSQTQANVYNGSTSPNIRSAVGDDSLTNYWAGGNGLTGKTGWRYYNSNTQLDTTNTNVRSVEIHNGQLFGTAGAGTRGLFAIGTGEPQTATTSTNMINTGASGASNEFVLIDDPNNPANTSTTFGFDTAYIADDRAPAGGGGIQKWTWNGTAWSLAYTLSDGVGGNRGLAGQLDLSTGNVVLWATNAAQSKLEQVTDTGSGATFITLATAPTNDFFSGVALAPVPEPTFLGVAVLLPLLAARRRRK